MNLNERISDYLLNPFRNSESPIDPENILCDFEVRLQVAKRLQKNDYLHYFEKKQINLYNLTPKHPIFSNPNILFSFTSTLKKSGIDGKNIFLEASEYIGQLTDLSFLLHLFGESTYDTLYGVIAFESLSRGALVNDDTKKKISRACIEYLFKCRRPTHYGLSFPKMEKYTPNLSFYNRKSTPYIDLGIAHGIGGILLFLQRNRDLLTSEEDSFFQKQIHLLSDLNTQIDPNKGYPASTEALISTRDFTNGWCYGDISAGRVLINCCESDSKLKKVGVEILTRGLKNMLEKSQNINFCHGLCGAALIALKSKNLSPEIASLSYKLLHKIYTLLPEYFAQKNSGGFLEGTTGVLYTLESFSNHSNELLEDYFMLR